jgi:hypothetical protein
VAEEAYMRLAEATNGEIAVAWASLTGAGASLEDQRDAIAHLIEVEGRFISGMASISLPPVLDDPVASLRERSAATRQLLAATAVLASRGDVLAAIPELGEAYEAESVTAGAVRAALYQASKTFFNGWAVEPPLVSAGPPTSPAGELEWTGGGHSTVNGEGTWSFQARNPTDAFAFGVAVRVDFYAYEGPFVESRRAVIAVVPPQWTASITEELQGVKGIYGKTEGVIESVAERRAAAEVTIHGR